MVPTIEEKIMTKRIMLSDMTKIIGKITIILFLLWSHTVSAQNNFPDKCIGKWSGMMMIYQKGILRDSVLVELHVKKINDTSWAWKTEYISPKMPITKDYILRLKDKATHHYVTDEGDGIVLNESIFENKCFSVFITNEMLITSRYELISPDILSFEVTSSRSAQMIGGELRNYDVTSLQSVLFTRVKK